MLTIFYELVLQTYSAIILLSHEAVSEATPPDPQAPRTFILRCHELQHNNLMYVCSNQHPGWPYLGFKTLVFGLQVWTVLYFYYSDTSPKLFYEYARICITIGLGVTIKKRLRFLILALSSLRQYGQIGTQPLLENSIKMTRMYKNKISVSLHLLTKNCIMLPVLITCRLWEELAKTPAPCF